MAYIHDRAIVIPQIVLDHPVVEADEGGDGKANWPVPPSTGTASDKPAEPNAGPKIGQLVINNGHAHVVLAKLKADFNLDVATRQGSGQAGADATGQAAQGNAPGSDSDAGQIVVDAKGTYAAQPITGRLIGGALLSLRDTAHPYPIDLHLANGPTHVALTGTVQNPLSFAGADLKLEFAGPDASKLTPLTGVPIPETPPYSIAGKLDYADKKVRFTGFTGRLGNSDLNGDILVDPTRERPFVEATLFSRQVELADLGGFIGETPGRRGEAQAPQQRAELARKEASDRVLPDTPINLPKLNAADVKLRYKGAHILGRSVPLDNIVADIDITNGRVEIHPLSFAVGTGEIVLSGDLQPAGQGRESRPGGQLPPGRPWAAAVGDAPGERRGHHERQRQAGVRGQFRGLAAGPRQRRAEAGHVRRQPERVAGGPGRAGVRQRPAVRPRRAAARQPRVLRRRLPAEPRRAVHADADPGHVRGAGAGQRIGQPANETIDYKLETHAKHFTVGSLPTPIDIAGKLKSPSIKPEIGPLALRGGAAVGLGILFPPAALLPTIQFGTGEDFKCQAAEAPIARSTPASIGVPHPVVRPPRPAPDRRPAVARTRYSEIRPALASASSKPDTCMDCPSSPPAQPGQHLGHRQAAHRHAGLPVLQLRIRHAHGACRQHGVDAVGLRGRVGEEAAHLLPGGGIEARLLPQFPPRGCEHAGVITVDRAAGHLEARCCRAVAILLDQHHAVVRRQRHDVHPVRIVQHVVGRDLHARPGEAAIRAHVDPAVTQHGFGRQGTPALGHAAVSHGARRCEAAWVSARRVSSRYHPAGHVPERRSGRGDALAVAQHEVAVAEEAVPLRPPIRVVPRVPDGTAAPPVVSRRHAGCIDQPAACDRTRGRVEPARPRRLRYGGRPPGAARPAVPLGGAGEADGGGPGRRGAARPADRLRLPRRGREPPRAHPPAWPAHRRPADRAHRRGRAA